MFKKKKNKENLIPQKYDGAERLTIIANGTTFKGTMNIEGNLRIDGTLEGDIYCKGKVVLGANGKITGDMTCASASLYGMLKLSLIHI